MSAADAEPDEVKTVAADEAQIRERYLRLRADFENLRRRGMREREMRLQGRRPAQVVVATAREALPA